MRNRPEYLESVFAAFKLGLPPVNTNYRYVDDELVYLWDNADTSAVVFEGQYAERIEGIRDRVGALYFMMADAGQLHLPRSNLYALARANWSQPPDHGAAAVRINGEPRHARFVTEYRAAGAGRRRVDGQHRDPVALVDQLHAE